MWFIGSIGSDGAIASVNFTSLDLKDYFQNRFNPFGFCEQAYVSIKELDNVDGGQLVEATLMKEGQRVYVGNPPQYVVWTENEFCHSRLFPIYKESWLEKARNLMQEADQLIEAVSKA